MEPPSAPDQGPRAPRPAPVASCLETAVHAWYERHRARRALGFAPISANPRTDAGREANAYWNAMLRHTRESLRVLAGRAEASLRCPHVAEGLAAAGDNTGRNDSARCGELADKFRAARFLRAVAQCVEVGLDVCVALSQAEVRDRAERETIPGVLDRRILRDIRPHLWAIAASMEPRLFWDPRPFWTGLEEPSCHLTLWKLYARLFLLASFDRFQALRAQRRRETRRGERGSRGGAESESEEEEERLRENLLFVRRSVRGPRDMGVGPDPLAHDLDDRDLEEWPMSILFAGLDSLTEGWNRLRYGPATQRLVARCLLRYAMLGYATTPAAAVRQARETGTRCAHDMPVYCVGGSEDEPVGGGEGERGAVGVNPDTYYGQGGAALREMLSDLCAVAHTDAWLRAMTPPTNPDGAGSPSQLAPGAILAAAPLLQRLHLTLLPPRSPPGAGGGEEEEEEEALEEGEGAGEEEVDGLMLYCGEVEAIAAADLALLPEMRRVARRCFASIRHFLNGREAQGAEKCFIKSGAVSLLLPGELWKFVRRWPDHGASAVNIINGMRERDMILYRDHIISPGVSSILEIKRSRYHTVGSAGAGRAKPPPEEGADRGDLGTLSLLRADGEPPAAAPWESAEDEETVQEMNDEGLKEALPGCLVTLVDHLVWEAARHMMRMVAIGEGTEALPSFLFEMHHARATRDLPPLGGDPRAQMLHHPVWAEFAVWTTALWESEGLAPSEPMASEASVESEGLAPPDPDFDEGVEGRREVWGEMMARTAERCQRLNAFPPFPQVLALRGRMFLWNPLAEPYAPPEEPEGGGGDQAALDREWVRECARSVLVDVTADAAPLTLFLWLKARRACVQALVDRIPRARTQLQGDSIRDRGEFKLRVYDNLALQWFGTRSQALFYY